MAIKKMGLAVAAVVLAACSVSTPAGADPPPNTDPRSGWVLVVADEEPLGSVSVYKRCDGGTLLYLSPGSHSGAHSVAAVPGSPECLPS